MQAIKGSNTNRRVSGLPDPNSYHAERLGIAQIVDPTVPLRGLRRTRSSYLVTAKRKRPLHAGLNLALTVPPVSRYVYDRRRPVLHVRSFAAATYEMNCVKRPFGQEARIIGTERRLDMSSHCFVFQRERCK